MSEPTAAGTPRPPGVACRPRVRLAAHTSFRIGGPADWLAQPSGVGEIGALLGWARREGVPVLVLGRGTNLLIPDEGVRGVVLSTERLRRVVVEGTRIRAGAGVCLRTLLRLSLELGLSGLEPLVGVPGTVGGAIRMNAGPGDGGIADRVQEILLIDAEGRVRRREAREIAWAYRSGGIDPGAVVVQAVFALRRGDRGRMREAMRRAMAARIASQPIGTPSAGCVFRNPPGRCAGRLIDRAGLRGLRMGGACVSRKHANFIVNDRGATAREVRALIDRVRREIAARYGTELELEVVLA